jgi:pilus assembly protein Flp/PilA
MLRKYIRVLAAGLSRLGMNKSGVTAIEYGLIAGAIAVVIIGAVTQLGGSVQGTFQRVADALNPPAAGGGAAP